MQIDTLAGGTIKITLAKSDMHSYNICYEDIIGHSRQTRLALSELICAIREKEGLRLLGDRMLVEAFPTTDEGCLLYISCLGRAARSESEKAGCHNGRYILAESSRLDDIIALCHVLKINCGNICSVLYYLDGCYRLIISAFFKADFIEAVSGEYADVSVCESGIKSETAEYYRLICYNAVEKLSALF
jgi:negative regulator of genetic competence, sporulation and motility